MESGGWGDWLEESKALHRTEQKCQRRHLCLFPSLSKSRCRFPTSRSGAGWGNATPEITLRVQGSISPALSHCLAPGPIPRLGSEWHNVICRCMTESPRKALESRRRKAEIQSVKLSPSPLPCARKCCIIEFLPLVLLLGTGTLPESNGNFTSPDPNYAEGKEVSFYKPKSRFM